MRHSPNVFGLTFGIFLALWHTIWSVLVATGAAQPIIDWIFWLHMITPIYKIEPFSLGRAAGLISLTGAIGYIFGFFIGLVWNRLSGKSAKN